MATIEKRGNGYRITVSLGYDVDGKQIKERTVWYPDPGMSEKKIKSELNKEAVRFEDLCRQRGVRGGNTKLEQFAETWFSDYAEQQLKPRTVEGYRYLWKRVRQGLGHLPLVKITPVRIIAFYGELAKELSKRMGRVSMAGQAIGGAVGHNPISIIVPCHRVVGSNGSLTGYAGGIDKKAKLLALEKAVI